MKTLDHFGIISHTSKRGRNIPYEYQVIPVVHSVSILLRLEIMMDIRMQAERRMAIFPGLLTEAE